MRWGGVFTILSRRGRLRLRAESYVKGFINVLRLAAASGTRLLTNCSPEPINSLSHGFEGALHDELALGSNV